MNLNPDNLTQVLMLKANKEKLQLQLKDVERKLGSAELEHNKALQHLTEGLELGVFYCEDNYGDIFRIENKKGLDVEISL